MELFVLLLVVFRRSGCYVGSFFHQIHDLVESIIEGFLVGSIDREERHESWLERSRGNILFSAARRGALGLGSVVPSGGFVRLDKLEDFGEDLGKKAMEVIWRAVGLNCRSCA